MTDSDFDAGVRLLASEYDADQCRACDISLRLHDDRNVRACVGVLQRDLLAQQAQVDQDLSACAIVLKGAHKLPPHKDLFCRSSLTAHAPLGALGRQNQQRLQAN